MRQVVVFPRFVSRLTVVKRHTWKLVGLGSRSIADPLMLRLSIPRLFPEIAIDSMQRYLIVPFVLIGPTLRCQARWSIHPDDVHTALGGNTLRPSVLVVVSVVLPPYLSLHVSAVCHRLFQLWRPAGRRRARQPTKTAVFLYGGQRRRDAQNKQRSLRSRNWSRAVRVPTSAVTRRRPVAARDVGPVTTDVLRAHIDDSKSTQSNRATVRHRRNSASKQAAPSNRTSLILYGTSDDVFDGCLFWRQISQKTVEWIRWVINEAFCDNSTEQCTQNIQPKFVTVRDACKRGKVLFKSCH